MYVISGKRLLACAICISICMAALQGIFFHWYGIPSSAAAITIDLEATAPPEKEFSVTVLSVSHPKDSYRVYIYHTHTYEAYDMRDGNQYKPTETWRTADNQYNVVRLGAELAEALEQAGVQVTHDTAAYEMPRLSSAYSRSLTALEEAVKEDYDLYIDLHRDSYSANNGPNTVMLHGRQAGRFLFLIGMGTGTELEEKPDWQANERVAQAISDALNAQAEGLSRGISRKSGRYNQQAATPCILIEAGNNQNTLGEMLNTIPALAEAICSYLDTLD